MKRRMLAPRRITDLIFSELFETMTHREQVFGEVRIHASDPKTPTSVYLRITSQATRGGWIFSISK